MKIRNIFYLLITILLLNACSSRVDIVEPKIITDDKIEEGIIDDAFTQRKIITKDHRLKVATILPLTGQNAKIGQAMLNAINLSLFDNDNKERIELVIIDNKSSDYYSQKAIDEVIQKNIKIVIGPIFTNSVESIIEKAQENNIIVLSFSNNSDLINKNNVFLAGFSPEQEIDRITSYLIEDGRNNFSVIAPNNQYGIRIVKTLREMVEMKDANFISSQFYLSDKKDFSKIANNIVNSYIVSEEFEKNHREELDAIEDKEEREQKEVELVAKYKIYADTILIAESSNKVFNIVKEIQRHNIDGRDIKIIGTSHWDKEELLEDISLYSAWFSGVDGKYYARFKEKYQQIYGTEPIRISSIAYDITAFVIDLASELEGQNPHYANIVNYNDKRGYRGIDGLFRFLPNGIIERNLSVIEINNQYFKTIDRAPRRFLRY